MEIKTYTDIEQSRKLAEFLPFKSADMFYFDSPFDGEYFKNPRFGVVEHNTNEIPCWSLAALFKVIPVVLDRAGKKYRLRMDESETDFDIWYEEIDMGLAQLDLDVIAPNMVDACVAMIEKLHNERLL